MGAPEDEADSPQGTGRFFMIYGLMEGALIILCLGAWWFVHRDVVLLLGSVFVVAMAGSLVVMARLIGPGAPGQKDGRRPSSPSD